MSDAALSIVTRTQGNNAALKRGEVAPQHHRLEFVEVPVLVQAFRRMVRSLEFDITEMAITTYMCAREHGVPITAIPVFLVRGFHHGAIAVNRGSGVEHPKDLEGRKVGVNRGYTVTTGVWARGVLHDEYGVDLDRVTWVLSGDEHVEAYRPPANVVPLDQVVPGGGKLGDLVAAGTLDAAVGADVDHPDVVPLIHDPVDAGYAALVARGHYPINHLVVVRDDVLERLPDLAADLFGAFTESKQRYLSRLLDGDPEPLENPTGVDEMHRRVAEITGADPLPYGIGPNRAVLDELIRHAVDQHILSSAPDVESLFAAGTHDLAG
jgi:4,5-dihydroxyphthalate decarboxylase